MQCYDYPHPAAEKTKAEGSRSVGEHRPEHKVNKRCAVEFSQGSEVLGLYSFEGHSNSQRSLLKKWKSSLFRAACLIVLENIEP